MSNHALYIDPAGRVRCLYTEAINLSALGDVSISRASRVEPGASGSWLADLSPVGGPVLGPYPLRSQALKAESTWIGRHVLSRPPGAARTAGTA